MGRGLRIQKNIIGSGNCTKYSKWGGETYTDVLNWEGVVQNYLNGDGVTYTEEFNGVRETCV